MIIFVVQSVFLLATFLAALRYGESMERYVASALLTLLLVNLGYDLFFDDTAIYSSFPVVRALLDCACLLAFYILAFRSNEWWVLWVGSAQNLSVAAHILRLAGLEMQPLVHAILDQWPFWIEIAITAGAIYRRRSGAHSPT